MARAAKLLTDTYVRSSKLKPGRHSDGGNLYLYVGPTGGKSWLFMWAVSGKRREMGLGPYPEISLAAAREKAESYRGIVAAGGDPIAARDKVSEPTFAEATKQFLDANSSQWRNDKHVAQWASTLRTYCGSINDKAVSTVSTEHVLTILTPLWAAKAETASRLRGRIERVLDFARAKGWRDGENPARWKGHISGALPARQQLQRGHHAALPYADIPALVTKLRTLEGMSARAMEFIILNASRSGEVLNATWDEVDMEGALWTIPAHRMKAGKIHRVPLSAAALAILTPLAETRVSQYVFPGMRPNRPLSNMATEMLLRRLKLDVTTHGFRSGFRDWAGDETNFQREVVEAALAHAVGDAVERAYRRSDALEKRRKLMDAWAAYSTSAQSASVIPMIRKS